MLEEQRQRILAMRAATQMKRAGMSPDAFRNMVDMAGISPIEVSDACEALRSRGELDHLIAWVWTFRRA